MKARDLDKAFDSNHDDVLDHFDLDTAQRSNREQRRVNVDFPSWMVESLDQEAQRLGVTRQSLIKLWLADRLDHRTHPQK
ncbi:MAG: CopG family transcriptional regulator [Pseudomonadota bacterium]